MFLNREGLSDARVVLITQKVRFCSTIFVIIKPLKLIWMNGYVVVEAQVCLEFS